MDLLYILRHSDRHVIGTDIIEIMVLLRSLIVVLMFVPILMQVGLLRIPIFAIMAGGVVEGMDIIQLTILMQISSSYHH